MSTEKFRPHSQKQEEAIFSDKPLTVLCSGIQFGKTTVGAIRMKLAMCKHTDERDNFLIVAPTYKILEQSTLPPFLRLMDGLGTFNKSMGVFKMHNGGRCYMRTNHEPDSIVGMTNIRSIWGDEAGLYTRYFWENIQGRASFKQAQITLTTSPYSMNWLYKDVIKPFKEKKRTDVLLIQARSNENPYFPAEEYEARKAVMEPRRFNAMYGGEFERMEGMVYDCFDENENVIEPLELPMGTVYVGGVDFGTTAPFAVVIIGITPNGNHYVVGEYYKTGHGIRDMVIALNMKKQTFGVERFYCDPSEPGYIQELNRDKLTAIPAINDVKPGISLTYELIKSRRLKFFRGMCPNLLDEMATYHWPDPKDLRPDQDEKERNPVKQYDHALDALRYICSATFRGSKKHVPMSVEGDKEESRLERLERLKRKSSIRHTENWG